MKRTELIKLCDDIAALLKEGYDFHGAFYSLTRVLGLDQEAMSQLRKEIGQELGKRKKRRPAPIMRPTFNFKSEYKDGDLIVTDDRTSFEFVFVNRGSCGPLLAVLTNKSGTNPCPTKTHEDAAFAFAHDEFARMRDEERIVTTKQTNDVFVVHVCGQHEVAFTCALGKLSFTLRTLTARGGAIEVDGLLFSKVYKLAEKHFGLSDDFGPLFR